MNRLVDQSDDGVNVLGLKKGNEVFVFLYPDDKTHRVLRKLGEFASRKELNFSWYDAAVLSQQVRENQIES